MTRYIRSPFRIAGNPRLLMRVNPGRPKMAWAKTYPKNCLRRTDLPQILPPKSFRIPMRSQTAFPRLQRDKVKVLVLWWAK